jgi:hypothetical protein
MEMWLFSKLADGWDIRKDRTKEILNNYVARNPNQFAIIVATSVDTSMTLGSGIIDLLRLGDGLAKGTLGGAAQDTLRVIGVAAPMAKGLQLFKSWRNTRLTRLIFDVGGPRCSWISSTKALVQTGHKKSNGKLFASVDDLLAELRLSIGNVGGISLSKMTSHLRQIGAKIGAIREVSSVGQVVNHLKSDGSVLLVSLKCMKNGKLISGHAVYFYKTFLGRTRIMDRTGEYTSLTELVAKYRAFDAFIPRAFVPLENIFAKYLAPKGTTALTIEVLGVTHAHPETIVNN